MTEPIAGTGDDAIAKVRDDMRVIDQAGSELGRVEFVKMGDADAVTTAGQQGEHQEGGLVGVLGRLIGGREPDVPEPLAARLLRTGFVKVDGKGLMGRDLYVTADQIDRVDGEAVHLNVTQQALIDDHAGS
ncbi:MULTISPECIES: hypothetical protein [unclassified Kribbella]|uniref:hypothetical protein n=1 Tax=unclassified Kribbella TaxID=2644121 RepID=UPI0033C5E5DD